MPGIFQALYTPYHTECLKKWEEAGSDNIPILLLRKQKLRKVNLLHKKKKWYNRNMYPVKWLISKAGYSTTALHSGESLREW